MNICLCEMTRDLCHTYLQEFTHDPDLFMDDQPFTEYVYSRDKADTYWQRQQDLGRVHLAIMLGQEPIGEIVLKNIDHDQKCCTLGICMRNDSVKNQGYGTKAEQLALGYAFEVMGMDTVFADSILKNTRSQHVLMKVGFKETHQDGAFRYYRCDNAAWNQEKQD